MNQILTDKVQYVSDADGNPVSVIIPIELWQTILADSDETAYLLQSEAMKKRLIEAKNRPNGIPFETVRHDLGV